MEAIRRLPVLMGAGAALLTGVASWFSGHSGSDSVARMGAALAVFFVLGLVIRQALIQIANDVLINRFEKDKKTAETARKKTAEAKNAEETLGKKIDLRAAEPINDTAFNPGRVADFIRGEIERK